MINQIHLFTTLLAFLFLLNKPCNVLANENIIAETCKLTQFPQECISNLESDPRSSSADFTGLSKIAYQLSATKVNETMLLASQLVFNSTDYEAWSFLQVCLSYYKSISKQIFNEGIVAFDKKKYDKAYQVLEKANQAIVGCNNTNQSPLYESNTMNYRFITDTMAIINKLF
ncbi:hypothetical protein Patl1_24024 [Pistacia atlantica]|uniref:Uncharacterized protein n=1 Tax=Pistacia atlantica TaxID=434234 RepID=A0ACC0ZX42_9ROSI|nr:hypothetical protein Patl1_24024 [Pistacia atlantica]